jgi:two-component sensor histidine kinase
VNAITTSPWALQKIGALPPRISRAAVTALAAVLVALIGWVDFLTGEFSLAVFYLAPVALATWYAGRVSGWFIGLLSAAAWLVGDMALSHSYGHPLMPYWNAAMLALIYGVVVQLLSALLRNHAKLEERVERGTISLAEVHHRVKNNLQVISSLLMLQAEKITNAADKAVLGECCDRIYSMARLHEQLYSRGEFADSDFAAHLKEITEMLVRAHTPPGCNLTLKFELDPVSVDLDMAVTLGLIANELILNSLKHAFVGRGTGILTVQLRNGAPLEMTVFDDGIGLPPGFDSKNNGSLGLELVNGLTRQIRGEATIRKRDQGGTCTIIRFQTPDYTNPETRTSTRPTPHE